MKNAVKWILLTVTDVSTTCAVVTFRVKKWLPHRLWKRQSLSTIFILPHFSLKYLILFTSCEQSLSLGIFRLDYPLLIVMTTHKFSLSHQNFQIHFAKCLGHKSSSEITAVENHVLNGNTIGFHDLQTQKLDGT